MTVVKNWAGTLTFTPTEIHSPQSEAEVSAIIKACRTHGRTLRVIGSGHSFTPLIEADVLVSLDKLAGLVDVDAATCRVTVWAGTKIKALGKLLAAHGLAQPNLGDIDVQSIAGAIGTGTHGSGVGLGSLSTQVTALRLATASGEVLNCSETENREIFKAAQVSFGALGVITQITLQCVPAYTLHYRWQKLALSECLAKLATHQQDNRNFEFFWIPHTEATLAKFMNITARTARAKGMLRRFQETVLENGVLWLLSAFARGFPSQCKRVARLIGALISSGEDVTASHETFATVRVVKFVEMEYNIPIESFTACLQEIKQLITREDIRVHFPVECRFVRGDDITLSPAHGRDSAYIAVHMFEGMPYEAYFDAVEAIFRRYGGRPHWGKLHKLGHAELSRLYPLWDDFWAVQKQLDPTGMFLNAHLRRIAPPTTAAA